MEAIQVDVLPEDHDIASCNICRDLFTKAYNARGAQINEDDERNRPDAPLDAWYDGSLRWMRFSVLAAAADQSCRWCGAIRAGTAAFWGPDPANLSPAEKEAVEEWLKQSPSESHELLRERLLILEPRPGHSLLAHRGTIDFIPPSRSGYESRPLQFHRGPETIEFFTNGRRPAHPSLAYAPRVRRTLDLTGLAATANLWLRECDSLHQQCAADTIESSLPWRVLDVSNGKVSLYQPRPGEVGRYLTCSHCWGASSSSHGRYHDRTTLANLMESQDGIPWHSLPPLYQDVIEVTRALGARFLWVDSLCIVQDDAGEWLEQSAQMGQIYANAYCNIAATAMANGEHRLFRDRFHSLGGGKRSLDRHIPLMEFEVEFASEEDENTSISVRQAHTREHDNLLGRSQYPRSNEVPLLRRAWIFQERLLSRRTIHVGASEMMWECRSTAWCECGGLTAELPFKFVTEDISAAADGAVSAHQPERKFSDILMKRQYAALCRNELSREDAMDFWSSVISEYAVLQLSFESDRSIALAGIAQQIQAATGYTYLAGLWLEDMARALCWDGAGVFWGRDRTARLLRNRRLEEDHTFTERPIAGAPTWSWLSRGLDTTTNQIVYWNAPVKAFKADQRVVIHAESTFCECRDMNPFAEVLSGQLDLTAPFFPGSIEKVAASEDETRKGIIGVRIVTPGRQLTLPYDHRGPSRPAGKMSAWIGTPVTCIALGRSKGMQLGLVLQALPNNGELFHVLGTHHGTVGEGTNWVQYDRADGVWENAPVGRFKIV